MLNEKKIRLMTKLTQYEKKEGKEGLKLAKYYRSDYMGISLFKNFFWVTLGYLLILMMVAVYHMEYIMDNIHKMDLLMIVLMIVISYGVVVSVYSVITYGVCTFRYARVRKSLENYDDMLRDLEKIYEREEKQKEQKQEIRRNGK